jgi:serine/threonine-protein kinase
MVYVPAGQFQMGSTEGQRDERPVHTVTLDGFWIDRTEVTNGQYERCVAARVCEPPYFADSRHRDEYYGHPNYVTFPVIKVGWFDARAYCEWAGARLPTEAEWEYAACGNDGRIYPWGDEEPNCDKANYWHGDEGCIKDTAPVGYHSAGVSWCGTHDMAGNVWEWVADVYGVYPAKPQVNQTGPSAGRYRVLRGGSWFNDAFSMRCANRDRDPADSPYAEGRGFYSTGFRCARNEK